MTGGKIQTARVDKRKTVTKVFGFDIHNNARILSCYNFIDKVLVICFNKTQPKVKPLILPHWKQVYSGTTADRACVEISTKQTP